MVPDRKSDKLHRVRARKDITIRLDLYEWGESKIEDGEFWNWSHLVERGILMLKRASESASPEKRDSR